MRCWHASDWSTAAACVSQGRKSYPAFLSSSIEALPVWHACCHADSDEDGSQLGEPLILAEVEGSVGSADTTDCDSEAGDAHEEREAGQPWTC